MAAPITINKAQGVTLSPKDTGEEIYSLAKALYPICRSITGNGVRETLSRIAREISLEIKEVASGTQVFDWTVPKEWNIRDAYIKNSTGERVVDFRNHNLHVVNYSIPVQRRITFAELRPHLHTVPDQPDWIPYRTSYYKEDWGFCLAHNQFLQMGEDEYEIYIDSSLEPGSLTYGECFLPGESTDEVLISTHVCHPSLCNDNLSGIGVATYLAKHLSIALTRYSYRFLFVPGTIGSIAWLALNEQRAGSIRHGIVLTGLGDAGHCTYKKSRRSDAEIDRAMLSVLKHSGRPFAIEEFSPYGYDERQYCSPGFNLPVGCLMRTPHGKYPEYHSSADNLSFILPDSLGDSLVTCLAAIRILENNHTYRNLNPKCEPQLGRRGLYSAMGGLRDEKQLQFAMLWVLNQSDGSHSLLDIVEKSGLRFDIIHEAASLLEAHSLLEQIF